MDRTIEKFKNKLNKEWKDFVKTWNKQLRESLIAELEGENRLFYSVKIDDTSINYLLNMTIKHVSIRHDNDDVEIDFKIYSLFNNKEIEILGTMMPGDKTSEYEEEKEDYYQISRCDDDLIAAETDGGLSILFASINLMDKITELSNKSENLHDLIMDKYHELEHTDN